MNRIQILLFIFLYSVITCSGQGSVKYTLLLKDMHGKALSYTNVWLVETETKKKLAKQTDGNGTVVFDIESGKKWTVNFKDIRDHTTIEVPERGKSQQSQMITYVPPELNKQREIPDRTGVEFEIIKQKITASQRPTRTEAILRIIVREPTGTPVKSLSVDLACIKFKQKFCSKTNNYGEARFLLPVGCTYEIDIDGTESFDHFDIPERAGMILRTQLIYRPTNIEETVENDTVRQELPYNPKPTSTRAYVSVTLKNYEGELLEDEELYYDVVGEKTVYAALTNMYGIARFLLPKGKKYILNFKYERGVEMFDNMNVGKLTKAESEYSYRGSKAIEEFYETTNRDPNGFIIDFMGVEVNKQSIDYDYLEKTEHGYNFNFKSETPTLTPAIGGSRLYMNAGFYTPELYSFDALTGEYQWGLKLAENGISSAVYDDGVIFVNTYSCTLYAINANTGELLWSKWLGPVIYSTPSVANGNVYTAYPNDLGSMSEGSNKWVLVCFDLKTGDINWQNWMDTEVLSSPVVTDKYVYLTSQAGKLFQFENTSGKKIGERSDMALTPPTIVKDKLYVSVKKQSDPTQQEIAIYNANDLTLIKRVPELSAPVLYNYSGDMTSAQRMNYCGCQMTHYKGKNYNVMGNRLICSGPDNGSIIWSKEIPVKDNKDKEIASMPVIVSDKLLISTTEGKIQIYDPQNGSLVNEYDTQKPLWMQLAVHNGIIYSSTTNGKMVSVNTGDKNMTGWPMWGKDASHNTVVY